MATLEEIQAESTAKRMANKWVYTAPVSPVSATLDPNVIRDEAKALNAWIKEDTKAMTSPPNAVAPVWSNVKPTETPPSQTFSDMMGAWVDQKREEAYADFAKEAGLTTKNDQALDLARQELSTIGQGETFEQMYERMKKEGWYDTLRETLLGTNEEIRAQSKWLKRAQEQVFDSQGGVMDAGLQQLRARNSRDFIRNLSDLSDISANSTAQIESLLGNIDRVMTLRKQDREAKKQDIENRIKMLENTVSPTQLALIKTKLEQKLTTLGRQEEAEAEIVKQKNLELLKNGDINSKDPDLQKRAVMKAINDALAPYASKGITLNVPATAHADNILRIMKSWKSFEQAFQDSFMTPFMNSPSVQNVKAQLEGNEWKSTSISRVDPETGAVVSTPVFYRTKWAWFEVQWLDGKPISSSILWSGQIWEGWEISWGGATPWGESISYIDLPRDVNGTKDNVWQDANNPWNIMGDTEGQRAIATRLGAVWFYKSSNGRTYAVFPDMQTWINASISDIKTKLAWGSTWATPETTLEKFASGWVSWPNAPINKDASNNFVLLTGYSKDTPIKNIPVETLAKAVFRNEGVDTSRSAKIPSTTTQISEAPTISEVPKYDKSKVSQYIDYIEKWWNLPEGIKEWSNRAKRFKEEATIAYTEEKNKLAKQNGFEIANPDAFIATTPKQKEEIMTAIKQVKPFEDSMNRLIELTKKYNTELPWTKEGRAMSAEVRNAQLLAKEIYNLWVLNWPDLTLMESIITNPTNLTSKLTGWQDYAEFLENAKQTIMNNAKSQASSVWLSYLDKWGADIIYTDDSWVKYTKESLNDELNRAVQSWEVTEEQARKWLKDNNITL